MRCGRRPRLLADGGLNFAFMGISFVLVWLTGKDVNRVIGCRRFRTSAPPSAPPRNSRSAEAFELPRPADLPAVPGGTRSTRKEHAVRKTATQPDPPLAALARL